MQCLLGCELYKVGKNDGPFSLKTRVSYMQLGCYQGPHVSMSLEMPETPAIS